MNLIPKLSPAHGETLQGKGRRGKTSKGSPSSPVPDYISTAAAPFVYFQ